MFARTHSEAHVSVSVCTPGNAYPRFHDAILSTKYFDDETDLAYYGYRYYSPELGRWVNRDPVAEQGGASLYGFVENEPIGHVDVLGLGKLVVIVGPHFRFSSGNYGGSGYVGPVVTPQKINIAVKLGQDLYKKDTGKECSITLNPEYSSMAHPMDLSRLQNLLSSQTVKDADRVVLIFHGKKQADGQTGILLFQQWIDQRSGWGKAVTGTKPGEVIMDQSKLAESVDELLISCCYSGKLPKQAGGVKISVLGASADKSLTFEFDVLPSFILLVKDLCCIQQEEKQGKAIKEIEANAFSGNCDPCCPKKCQ